MLLYNFPANIFDFLFIPDTILGILLNLKFLSPGFSLSGEYARKISLPNLKLDFKYLKIFLQLFQDMKCFQVL
jgi:hypothetical protein